MSSSDLLGSAFQALAHRAWDTNRARAAELAGLLADWQQAGELSAEHHERARVVAHSLRGSAGTFGHAPASDAAAELQELLSATATPQIDVVSGLVERIEAALEQAPLLDL